MDLIPSRRQTALSGLGGVCCVWGIKVSIHCTAARTPEAGAKPRVLYPLRSAVWNDKHTAAHGEGHRHNRWPRLHWSQAKPTQIINPAAYMLNILNMYKMVVSRNNDGVVWGGSNLRQQDRVRAVSVSFVKFCRRTDLLPQGLLLQIVHKAYDLRTCPRTTITFI